VCVDVCMCARVDCMLKMEEIGDNRKVTDR
jgi:hypothetical protein